MYLLRLVICLQCPDLEGAVQASKLCLGDPVLHWAYHHVSGLSCLVRAILGGGHVSACEDQPTVGWRRLGKPVGLDTISKYQELS